LSVAVIEKFEEAEGRRAGEVSIADLSAVLKLKKDLCTAQVCFLEFVIFVYVLQKLLYLSHLYVCVDSLSTNHMYLTLC